MAYTKNPYLPRVRRDAADLVRRGWGVRKVARYVGVSPGTISQWFTDRVFSMHRHSRVRRPSDNAYLERFNRTVQEECLDVVPKTVKDLNRALRKYIPHYNGKRLHFGLNLRTPLQALTAKRFQAID